MIYLTMTNLRINPASSLIQKPDEDSLQVRFVTSIGLGKLESDIHIKRTESTQIKRRVQMLKVVALIMGIVEAVFLWILPFKPLQKLVFGFIGTLLPIILYRKSLSEMRQKMQLDKELKLLEEDKAVVTEALKDSEFQEYLKKHIQEENICSDKSLSEAYCLHLQQKIYDQTQKTLAKVKAACNDLRSLVV